MSTTNLIVISGLPGSGKSTLKKKLGNHLNWSDYSIGDTWREKWKKSEHSDRPFEDYWRNIPISEHIKINDEALPLYKTGNLVVDTRYTIMCKDLPALFIFLTASIKDRVLRVKGREKYKNKNEEEIEKILRQREKDELAIGQLAYQYDFTDPLNYHVIINTSKMNIETEIKTILSYLE